MSPVWEGLSQRLEGRIVVLEPLAPEHADGLREAAADPAVWRLMTVHGHQADVFDEWFEWTLANAAAGIEAPFAIILRDTGEPVGSSRYMTLRPEHRGLEIGWTWHTPRVWGTGVNVDAKRLLLAHAFEDLGCLRVEFKTDAANERSRAALEALPARFEGVFLKHMLVRDGERRDSAYYAITDDEWPAVRANLERRLDTRTGSTRAPRERK
jgi:RimJ/RimL family protein N-acetyltransferase